MSDDDSDGTTTFFLDEGSDGVEEEAIMEIENEYIRFFADDQVVRTTSSDRHNANHSIIVRSNHVHREEDTEDTIMMSENEYDSDEDDDDGDDDDESDSHTFMSISTSSFAEIDDSEEVIHIMKYGNVCEGTGGGIALKVDNWLDRCNFYYILELLRDCTTIRWLVITRSFFLSNRVRTFWEMKLLFDTISTLPNLKSLSVTWFHPNDRDYEHLERYLTNSPTIKRLRVKSFETPDPNFLRTLASIPPTILDELHLGSTRMSSPLVSEILEESNVQALTVSSDVFSPTFADLLWLAPKSTVSSLTLRMSSLTWIYIASDVLLCLEREDSSLKELSILPSKINVLDRPNTTFWSHLANALSDNTVLQRLTIGCPCPEGINEILLPALENNFYLWNIKCSNTWMLDGPNIFTSLSNEIEYVLNLNRRGRGKIFGAFDRPPISKKEDWIDLLVDQTDCLDWIFYVLTSNPHLCA